MLDCFRELKVKWSDNFCMVGWTSIHAYYWDYDSVEVAKRFCPRGYFTPTTFVDGDERRGWDKDHIAEKGEYGAPVYVLYKGA